MSDLKGLILRGSVLRTLMLFANMAVAFYMMPFLIHALGDRWYGMWTLVATFMGYYGYMDFGLSVAVQRYIAKAIGREDSEEINRLLSTSFVLFIVLGFIAFAITLGIAVAAPLFFSDPAEIHIFRIVLFALGLNVGFSFAMAPVNGLMTGNLRYDLATSINLAKLAIRTALIIYFIKSGSSIIALAFITLLADVGGNLSKIFVARRMFSGLKVRRKLYSRQYLSKLFSYGGKTFINQLAEMMRFKLDHFIIASFINLSAVTMFNIASQLVHYFRRLIGTLVGVLTPLYARYQAANDSEAVYKTYYFTSKVAAMISILIGGAAIIFGKDFIELWMGENYLPAYSVLVVLLVPMIFYLTQSPANSVIYGLGAVGILAKVSIIEATSNVILSIALVGPYGLIGVALGTGIPLTAFSIFMMILANKLVGSHLGDYIKHVTPVIIIASLSQVATWYIMQGVEIASYFDIIRFLFLLYPIQAVVIVFLVFSASELKLIKRTSLKALGINP